MDIKIMIDGKDASPKTALPIKWNELLDERLDEGRLSIRYARTRMFPIGSPVTITVDDVERNFIVSADEATEIPVGSNHYNHELSIIEPTKLLEGILVENLTFTNGLGRVYSGKQLTAERITINEPKKGAFPQGSPYVTPIDGDVLTAYSFDRVFGAEVGSISYTSNKKPTITVEAPNGQTFIKKCTTFEDLFVPLNVNNLMSGVYTIKYEFEAFVTSAPPITDHFGYAFNIAVLANYDALPKWNVATVIDRVLNLCEPHLVSEAPKYKLDPAQRDKFAAIESPEFAFTNMTLKEILDEIGGFIHGIPRLIKGASRAFDTIHYDMLGGTEYAEIASKRYISEILSQNIEDYATDIDSSIENLVNTLNADEGAITEPYANGFKTVRSEEAYARIEEGNMVISTSLPIYSVQKLEVITPENKIIGDLTPYVFEGAEYGRLSSFDGTYPTSKAFAVYYNLGEKNIKGLGFKPPNIFGDAFADYTIANIIYAVTGEKVDTSWWGKDGEGKYPRLAFRVTYTPIFSARVLQHKPYIERDAFRRTLAYSQSANLVETRYYGENLKGMIARTGNAEIVRTYRFRKRSLAMLPKIGQLGWLYDDDYYITSVTVAIYTDSVDITVGYSKDFNRLSEYVGINSEWRAYEVSERKAYNRDMIYRDFCIIGSPVAPDGISLLRNPTGIRYICNTFSQRTANQGDTLRPYEPITLATVEMRDRLGNDYGTYNIGLPVVSSAFGNAMVFSFGMQDNYSAGAKSVQQNPNNEVTGYWQTDVPYVDYYGRVAAMDFSLSARGKDVTAGDDLTFALPQYNQPTSGPIVTPNYTADNVKDGIMVDKDGSEILRFNYQLEYVTNWKDIIIGSALARNCPMVSGVKEIETDGIYTPVHSAKLYVLSDKVGKFDSTIDLTKATPIYDYSEHVPSYEGAGSESDVTGYISLGGVVSSTVNGVAWAIADKSNGEILLARNIDIESGGEIELPYLSFTHKLP